MRRYLMPTVVAGAMTAIVLVFAAYADGMPWQKDAARPETTAAAPAGCPLVPAADFMAGGAPVPATADLGGTAGTQNAEAPEQLAERWRGETARWLGEFTRDLEIEYRYPVDVESEPNPSGRGFGPSGEA